METSGIYKQPVHGSGIGAGYGTTYCNGKYRCFDSRNHLGEGKLGEVKPCDCDDNHKGMSVISPDTPAPEHNPGSGPGMSIGQYLTEGGERWERWN